MEEKDFDKGKRRSDFSCIYILDSQGEERFPLFSPPQSPLLRSPPNSQIEPRRQFVTHLKQSNYLYY